jgi:hypothetical protein
MGGPKGKSISRSWILMGIDKREKVGRNALVEKAQGLGATWSVGVEA